MDGSWGDELPCLSYECGQDFIADQSDLDADPAFDSDVRRLEIDLGSFGDHVCLVAGRHGNPDGDAAVIVMIVREHDEDLLANEEGGFTMRELFSSLRKSKGNAADALDVVFGRENGVGHILSTLARSDKRI